MSSLPNSEKEREEGRWKVQLYGYDISGGMAQQMSMSLIGMNVPAIWHTCVVVYGKEYYYGGGIMADPVGDTRWGPSPLRIDDIGYTEVPEEVFETFLDEIRERYTMQTYDILHNNCNAFSEEVC